MYVCHTFVVDSAGGPVAYCMLNYISALHDCSWNTHFYAHHCIDVSCSCKQVNSNVTFTLIL